MRFSLTCPPTCRSAGPVLLSILLIVMAVHARGAGTPFAPVPAGRRPLLTKRLIGYTQAFRKKDWAALYDLVSDQDKISVEEGKDKVDKHIFIAAMQNTYEMRHLQTFTPVRTESGLFGYDIYGCGEVPGRDESIVAVRAVWEHGNWFFTDWQYTDPWEPCSRLSDPEWKPQIPLRLDGPMMELVCILNVCTL